jgi:hypothetical protein
MVSSHSRYYDFLSPDFKVSAKYMGRFGAHFLREAFLSLLSMIFPIAQRTATTRTITPKTMTGIKGTIMTIIRNLLWWCVCVTSIEKKFSFCDAYEDLADQS